MSVEAIKAAFAAWQAAEGESCPKEFDDGTHSFYGPEGARSQWYKGHWAREKAAKEALEKLLADELASRGVRIRTDGCGCCDSPALTVFIDDQFVAEGGNWYFDNLPKTAAEKAKAEADRLGDDA